MLPLVHCAVVATALHAALSAQNAVDRTPILDLRTSSADLARFVHDLYDSENAPPEAPGGDGSYRLLVTVDGDVLFTADEDSAPLCRLTMRPDQVWANAMDGGGVMTWGFRAFLAMALRDRGVPAWQMNRVLAVLRDFPDQLSTLELTLTGDLGDRIVLDLFLEPTPGSWLANVVADVEPAPRGAPKLRDPDAFVALSCAVRGDGLRELLTPFAEQVAHSHAIDAARGKELTDLAMQRIAAWDGSLAFLYRRDGSWLRLCGLRDEQAFEELSNSELGRMLDDDTKRVEGQDVAVIESGYSLTAHAPGDTGDLTRWSDRIREDRQRAWPLRDGALVEGELHFGNIPSALVDGTTIRIGDTTVDLDDEQLGWLRELRQWMPHFALFSLQRRDSRLRLHVESR